MKEKQEEQCDCGGKLIEEGFGPYRWLVCMDCGERCEEQECASPVKVKVPTKEIYWQ